jgi:tetratricopeptide (TPR) repeat protein
VKPKLLWLALLIVPFAGATDYVAARQAAAELAKAGKLAEAQGAFLTLAEQDVTQVQQADALAEAALLADRLGETAKALELAGRVALPHPRLAVRMQLLANHRQWRELVEQFGNEDFAAWPDTLVGNAAFARGRAHAALRQGKEAILDLTLATECLLEDNALGLSLIALGDAYSRFAKDDERALACYRQAYDCRNIYKRTQAAMNAAAILRSRREFDAARNELAVIPLDRVNLPFWRGKLLLAWGDTLAEAGKTAEAIAKYQEASRLKGVSKAIQEACQKALVRLEENGQ